LKNSKGNTTIEISADESINSALTYYRELVLNLYSPPRFQYTYPSSLAVTNVAKEKSVYNAYMLVNSFPLNLWEFSLELGMEGI